MYRCPRCKKCFDHKGDLNKHLKRKNPCSKINNSSKVDYSKVCQICDKEFSSKYKLFDHLENPNMLCYHKKRFQQPIQPIVNNYIQNVQNTTINNLTINVKLVKPGEETIDHISDEQLLYILDNNFETVIQEFMRLIYFNNEAPGNCHWCVGYLKETYGALQYNVDTEFIERLVTQRIVNTHFQNMLMLLSDRIGNLLESKNITRLQKTNINRYFQYIGKDRPDKEDYEGLKMLAFNNRSVPVKLWKKLGIEGLNEI